MSKINLDGGEISIIRGLGFSGAPMTGRDLKSRVGRMSNGDLADCLKTLIALGYVTSTPDLDRVEDLEKVAFAVNSGYAKMLKEAIDPEPEPTKRQRRV
ncbi:MAG: hypothetical protein WCO68_10705 [Verrucomicrobiota bacterium]